MIFANAFPSQAVRLVAPDSINDFLESLDSFFPSLSYLIMPFLKEDRIINVNATTIIIKGKTLRLYLWR